MYCGKTRLGLRLLSPQQIKCLPQQTWNLFLHFMMMNADNVFTDMQLLLFHTFGVPQKAALFKTTHRFFNEMLYILKNRKKYLWRNVRCQSRKYDGKYKQQCNGSVQSFESWQCFFCFSGTRPSNRSFELHVLQTNTYLRYTWRYMICCCFVTVISFRPS